MPLDGMQFGHYRLLHLIGSGGMGEVYQAEDIRIARQVAIKVIRTELTTLADEQTTQETERLFQREMKAIALLDHPHILPLYDFGEEKIQSTEYTYMVMPYRPEGSLTDWLRKRGNNEPLLLQDIAHIIAQAADALQHAHNHQIVHQDVKPSNFLIRSLTDAPNRPDLLLTDFGIAKLITATSSISQNIRGTPVYMAPEQWEGHPVLATDQYALGIMTYQLLTGRAPFNGRLEQLMHQHINVQPHPPGRINPRLSSAFDAVIMRALAKKPEERFPSISAFARAFQQAMHYAGDLRTTLAISTEDALQGIQRTITLPGSRHLSVTVPAGAQDGQVLRLPDQGEPYYEGGPHGPLVLTIMLKRPSASLQPDSGSTQKASPSGFHYANPTPPVTPMPTPPQIPVSVTPPVINPISQSGISQPGFAPSYLNNPNTPASVARPTDTMQTTGTMASTQQSANQQKSWWRSTFPTSNISPSNRTIILVLLALLLILPATIGIITNNHLQQLDQEQYATATTQARSLTATATASNPTAVAIRATAQTATENPYPAYLSKPRNDHGNLALFDPLSQPKEWQPGANNSWGGSCTYTHNAYDVAQSKPNRLYFCSGQTNYSDFAAEVQMKMISGGCGGLDFRDNGSNREYMFEICQDGTYNLYFYSSSTTTKTLLQASSHYIHQGQNQDNTLAVKAHGQTIDLYINQQWVNSTTDNSQSSGSIGFLADSSTHLTEITYTRIRIWTFGKQ
jgi:serine/threonine protein kinase